MPGMGGPNRSENFILNCRDWKKLYGELPENLRSQFEENPTAFPRKTIRLAPMTGAVENIGYSDEKQFYKDIVTSCMVAGAPLSLGDGCPDEKLLFGIEAVRNAGEKDNPLKAAVFIKPYSNKKILERMEWAEDIMEACGIDIDSYNIVTMRNKVNLEKKTASQLKEIQDRLSARGLPFAVKGVFTKEDIDMVKELKPDIIYISNHGGRVETVTGSVAEFLKAHGKELSNYCQQLWVDGGIRDAQDVFTAKALGAECVLLGRPFARALCYDRQNGIKNLVKKLCGGSDA